MSKNLLADFAATEAFAQRVKDHIATVTSSEIFKEITETFGGEVEIDGQIFSVDLVLSVAPAPTDDDEVRS